MNKIGGYGVAMGMTRNTHWSAAAVACLGCLQKLREKTLQWEVKATQRSQSIMYIISLPHGTDSVKNVWSTNPNL